jgi:hypothetical protein
MLEKKARPRVVDATGAQRKVASITFDKLDV